MASRSYMCYIFLAILFWYCYCDLSSPPFWFSLGSVVFATFGVQLAVTASSAREQRAWTADFLLVSQFLAGSGPLVPIQLLLPLGFSYRRGSGSILFQSCLSRGFCFLHCLSCFASVSAAQSSFLLCDSFFLVRFFGLCFGRRFASCLCPGRSSSPVSSPEI
jgi:hypothetical protein